MFKPNTPPPRLPPSRRRHPGSLRR